MARIKPMIKVAKMLQRHLPEILSYFRYRITNATNEGFNSRIQSIKSAARGFRDFQNYRTRILFYCGKLNLKPDLNHQVSRRTFYTPRHCSWLNQIEIWFGILRSKVTRWMSFPSLEELEQSILRYIEYYNSNFAHPFAWTYYGKVLNV